jgi:16S rRNA (cytidine1402-2'-O)-methyltransferase
MSGTLFVVATPIGNLEDITLRALRVLKEVDLIAAEDTRRTAKLLAHYDIPTATISFHEHNSRGRLPVLVAKLEAGLNVAVVSDAGTPGIADPGVALVQACRQRGIAVDPLPGASAPLTAAVASGFSLDSLKFCGFAPARSKDREQWLRLLEADSSTFVFFESPHRILRTLADMRCVFGDRQICVARELTKVHQQIVVGDAASVIGQITNTKGEFTIVVGPSTSFQASQSSVSDGSMFEEFCYMTDSGLPRRAAISALAKKYGRSANTIYASIEATKKVNAS